MRLIVNRSGAPHELWQALSLYRKTLIEVELEQCQGRNGYIPVGKRWRVRDLNDELAFEDLDYDDLDDLALPGGSVDELAGLIHRAAIDLLDFGESKDRRFCARLWVRRQGVSLRERWQATEAALEGHEDARYLRSRLTNSVRDIEARFVVADEDAGW